MDKEFHYWLTGCIANEAGFEEDEAKIIAYSSQYVDENDVPFKVEDKTSGTIYRNFISQTMNILKPQNDLMRIYPIFHFIPGEPDAVTARRRDGKQHILNTTPNSENANTIFDAALNVDDETKLYRIGIATHGYVDTWAHQNFVGWFDDFNHIGMDFKPNIGHADAEHHTDWVAHRWIDNRLVENEVNNKLRFMSAAKELFTKYCDYLAKQGKPNNSDKWPDLEKSLTALQGQTFTGNSMKHEEIRLDAYKNVMPWLPEFDERDWFDQAIDTEVKGLPDLQDGILAKFTIFKDRYYWKSGIDHKDTDWFKFQKSVKDHERVALKCLAPIYKQMAVKLA